MHVSDDPWPKHPHLQFAHALTPPLSLHSLSGLRRAAVGSRCAWLDEDPARYPHPHVANAAHHGGGADRPSRTSSPRHCSTARRGRCNSSAPPGMRSSTPIGRSRSGCWSVLWPRPVPDLRCGAYSLPPAWATAAFSGLGSSLPSMDFGDEPGSPAFSGSSSRACTVAGTVRRP